MSFLKYMLPFAMATSGLCFADVDDNTDGYATETSAKERDFDALQEYIKTKRAITVKEKGGNMMISGDIRGEYYRLHCVTDHKFQRGYDSRHRLLNSLFKRNAHRADEAAEEARKKLKTDLKENADAATIKKDKQTIRTSRRTARMARNQLVAPYATNEFDVQCNLTFDYIAERAWGTIRLQMENPCGITENDRKYHINDSRNIMFGSGRLNEIALRKGFAGYNFYEQGSSRFDMEIGRRRFFDVFDSRIQFGSYFDGILARYTDAVEGWADISAKVAAFVVDYTVNHYGYVGELALLNLADSGVDFKYSLIDWNLNRRNRFNKHHPLGTRFVNSQVLLAYNLPPDLISYKAQIYVAGLVNHAAPKTSVTHYMRANKAAYVGGQIGEALRKNDWAAEIYYMWVQAQAVSERDPCPASRDNPRRVSLYNSRWGGTSNYRGYRAEVFYALTDNWTLNAHFDKIRELSHRIGGKHRSTELQLSAIFAF